MKFEDSPAIQGEELMDQNCQDLELGAGKVIIKEEINLPDIILNENEEAINIKTEPLENLEGSFGKDELASEYLIELNFNDSQNYLNDKDERQHDEIKSLDTSKQSESGSSIKKKVDNENLGLKLRPCSVVLKKCDAVKEAVVIKEDSSSSSLKVSSKEVQANGSTYKCQFCENIYQNNQSLVEHMKIHPVGNAIRKRFECKLCGKSLATRSARAVHTRMHTGERPWECENCGKKFRDKWTLSKHNLLHTGEKPYECAECGARSRTKDSLILHIRTHTGEKPYECKVCPKKFTSSRSLTMHMVIHSEETPSECNICHKKFNHKMYLEKHIIWMHQEKQYKFKCDQCDRDFELRYQWQQHLKTHTGELPNCIECNKSFSDKKCLKKHIRNTHQKHKYPCKNCRRRFASEEEVIQHQSSHTKKQPYECEKCGQRFSKRDASIRHFRKHTGELPHECKDCGRKFIYKCHLETHSRIHTEKTFFHRCDKCRKIFRYETSFNSHECEKSKLKKVTT